MSRITNNRITKALKQGFENRVASVMQKFGYPSGGAGMGGRGQEAEPPYARQVPPQAIYQMRRKQSLVNNAIEEKVNQTFRRGFTEWEKEYIAECQDCGETFETIEPFTGMLGDDGDEIEEEDLDFSKIRPCPDCGEMAAFSTPDEEEKEEAQKYFDAANMRGRTDSFLEGDEQNSVGQTFLEVCKEVAWDIESFDDGWMLFQREYWTDHNGNIVDWELKGVHRGEPELMRYIVDEDGNIGGHTEGRGGDRGVARWVCVECRATKEHYTPDKAGDECQHCGAKTYRAFAERLEEVNGDAVEWYIRGEFAHASEYEPSKFYGMSPIITLWEEARTIEMMDKWYKEAYQQRRAPRGAMVVRSSNAESVRSWNQQQMQELKNDPQHIPTFIDDTEGKGQPLTWQPLLEEPAQMQHMQMREWFLDRISAKFGVTAIFQKASPENSGLSQSMEIIVSNRSAMRLKQLYDDTFLPAFLSQIQVEGWEKEVNEIEEEDEVAEAERIGKELKNAQLAQKIGADVEWTRRDTLDVKPGQLEPPEGAEGEEGMGGMEDMMGGGDDGGGPTNLLAGGGSGPEGGAPPKADPQGGAPDTPNGPSQDNPIQMQDGGGDGGGGNSVTTSDSGFSNGSYSGRSGGTINIFEHIEEQMDAQSGATSRDDLAEQAKKAYNYNFSNLGVDASTVQKFAQDSEKTFSDLQEEHYGYWMKEKRAKDTTEYLYELMVKAKQ